MSNRKPTDQDSDAFSLELLGAVGRVAHAHHVVHVVLLQFLQPNRQGYDTNSTSKITNDINILARDSEFTRKDFQDVS